MKRRPITTDLQLSKLKPEDKPYDVMIANVPGLYVTVGAKSKTFKWDRGAGHKPRKVTHGRYPQLSIKDAREKHEKAQLQHQQGTLGTVASDTPKNVQQLADLFYAERILPQRTRPDTVLQQLNHDVLPHIGSMKIDAVTPRVINNVIKIMVDRGAKTHSGTVLSTLKQMFKYAVAQGFLDTNPAQSIERVALGIVTREGDRVLTDQEIIKFWNYFHDSHPTKSLITSTALLLLLLLGVRTSELRLAKWSDVDDKNKTLTIPAANQKGNKEHKENAPDFVVPLSPLAFNLLERIRGIGQTYIFVGAKGDEPFKDKVLARLVKRHISRLIEEGDEHYTPHDLRRTLRTRLSALGVLPHIAEKCLNHRLEGVMSTYNHHDYLGERRTALKLWSDTVEQLTGSNVVQLRKSA